MQHKNITLRLIQFGTILKQHLKCHQPIVLTLTKVTGQMSTGLLSTSQLSAGQLSRICLKLLIVLQLKTKTLIKSSEPKVLKTFCSKVNDFA